MARKTIAQYAVEVLRRTDNPAVGWGDAGLLHEIADAAGLPHDGWRTEVRVLNALDKTPGELVKRMSRHRGLVRVFYLPERAP